MLSNSCRAEHTFVVMGNIDFHVLYNASNFLYLSAYKVEGENGNELEVLNLNQLFHILLVSWVKFEYSICFACILLHSEFQLSVCSVYFTCSLATCCPPPPSRGKESILIKQEYCSRPLSLQRFPAVSSRAMQQFSPELSLARLNHGSHHLPHGSP
jgi:hypothetical protein